MHATPFKGRAKAKPRSHQAGSVDMRNIVLIVATALAVLAVAISLDTRGRLVHPAHDRLCTLYDAKIDDELGASPNQVNIEVARQTAALAAEAGCYGGARK